MEILYVVMVFAGRDEGEDGWAEERVASPAMTAAVEGREFNTAKDTRD